MAIDPNKSIIGHYWRSYGLETSKILDMKRKESNTLLFETGLVHTFTYNYSLKIKQKKGKSFDLPDQETLNNFGPIKILMVPNG